MASIIWPELEDGIATGEVDVMHVAIEFVDNGEEQNVFQGDSLELIWEFIAKQGDGETVVNEGLNE